MPTLRESDIFIIHTGKERIQSIPGSVTIISCDLASKFANKIQECDFHVIIVVYTFYTFLLDCVCTLIDLSNDIE